MIWYLAKMDHTWAIRPWVRTWLRAGGLTRFVIVCVVSAFASSIAGSLSIPIMLLSENFSSFTGMVSATLICVWGFWLLDTIVEKRTTQHDIKRILASPSVALATRGEYIGGHPLLPHGRFVYLTLRGTLSAPLLTIVLPKPMPTQSATWEGGMQNANRGAAQGPNGVVGESMEEEGFLFSMPVMDIERTRERLVEAEEQVTTAVMLAEVTFQTKFIGPRAVLSVEYIGERGRRHLVEFGHFLLGDGEVQNWRNYIVCIQAQAETGQRPFGPWKTLPSDAKAAGANPGSSVIN